MNEIIRYLREQRWEERPGGAVTHFRNQQYVVMVVPHQSWWAVGEYGADGYAAIGDASSLEELKAVLENIPAVPRVEFEQFGEDEKGEFSAADER